MSTERGSRTRRTTVVGSALAVTVGFITSGLALAHDPPDVDPDALPLEIVQSQGDGIETLPTAKGPFPDTENMRFLARSPLRRWGLSRFPAASPT
ncbi:hypothetical protein [Phytoactinopolyspora mesophila]|uniref:Uncharacterized protein n=1 Tax=Phytoactinopolyspora mesophila TaxID=2650750 RepID=A0A7K3MBR9_9ACTN|nr:hypothetical protein [Phytoactinopolyspora mesophila]NDL60716.1 hypothetical protein [Phytoactinopolyspora mesophila]